MGLQSNWSLELHSNFSMDYLLLTLPVNNVAPLSSDSMISLTFEFSIFSKNWKKKIINNLTCNHCYTYPVHTTPLSGNKEEFPTCIHYFYMKFSTSRKFASASMHTCELDLFTINHLQNPQLESSCKMPWKPHSTAQNGTPKAVYSKLYYHIGTCLITVHVITQHHPLFCAR